MAAPTSAAVFARLKGASSTNSVHRFGKLRRTGNVIPVKVGPGATQLTRIRLCANNLARGFTDCMTTVLATQYATFESIVAVSCGRVGHFSPLRSSRLSLTQALESFTRNPAVPPIRMIDAFCLRSSWHASTLWIAAQQLVRMIRAESGRNGLSAAQSTTASNFVGKLSRLDSNLRTSVTSARIMVTFGRS